MNRLLVPIFYRMLYATGDILLRAELDLEVMNNVGVGKQLRFLVDSGTEITTAPAWLAKQQNLPMPQAPARLAIHAQTGLEMRSSWLRFRIVGLDQTEYTIPCLLLGDPNIRPGPNAPPRLVPRKLLQPFQLLEKLRFTADNDPSLGLPYGALIVEKR